MKIRSSADLVKHLDAIASDFTEVCLVVKFEKTNECVWASDLERKTKLDVLMSSGGKPIGVLGYTRDGERLKVRTKTLKEYSGQSWVRRHLMSLREPFYAKLTKKPPN